MSDREAALQLFDIVPDQKMTLLIAYMQGLTADLSDEPNEETVSAINEAKSLKPENAFEGSAHDFLNCV